MIGHMECDRCGCEVEWESDPRRIITGLRWYCPACDSGRADENVTFVENAPFEQVRWGFVDEDTIVIAWHVEDVLRVAPDLTVEDARDVLAMAIDNHDSNIGITWDVLEFWAGYHRVENGGDE